MKFNVILCSFIAIIFNCIFLTRSTYLFSSDLQFNIPEEYKSNFTSDEAFEQFLRNIIKRLKIRISEKLLKSLRFRNEIKNTILNKNISKIEKYEKSIQEKSKFNEITINFKEYLTNIFGNKESFEKMIVQNSSNIRKNRDPNSKLEKSTQTKQVKTQYHDQNNSAVQDEISIKISSRVYQGNQNLENIKINQSISLTKKNNSNLNQSLDFFEEEINESEEKKRNKENIHNGNLIHYNNYTNGKNNKNINLILKKNSNILNRIDKNFEENDELFEILKKNNNKTFSDFSEIFFSSEKNFQTKIFGKKLIDFIHDEYPKSKINNTFIQSFHKFTEQLKLDKAGKQERQYSKLKTQLDSFTKLEKEKKLLAEKEDNPINDKITNKTNLISNAIKEFATIEKNENLKKKIKNEEKRNKESSLSFDIQNHDQQDEPSIKKRSLKLFIDIENECDIFFEDKLLYEKDNFTNYFIDHMILNRKHNTIIPRGINSDDAIINYVVYNRKLNMFTINVEKAPQKEFSINYEYSGSGFISTEVDSSKVNNGLDKEFNNFKWKIYNENINNKKIDLDIEIYFSLGEKFNYDKIQFNYNFEKKIQNIGEKNITYYSWSGELLPFEILNIYSFFPIAFKNCNANVLNFSLIFVLALFVVTVILAVYLIIINIIKDFY